MDSSMNDEIGSSSVFSGGIQLKLANTKKRKQIETDFGNPRDADEDNLPKEPLVIPLIQPRRVEGISSQTETAREMTLEERAAAELVSELTKSETKQDPESLLTIKVQNNSTSVATAKSMPLLQANLAPELAGITNDDERFKVDLSLRADDVSFKSDRYKAVPVEEFGAALLRGMGWSGPSEEDVEIGKKLNEKGAPRIFRLGLGALAKPPEAKGSRIDKDTKAAIEKEWAKKVSDKLSKQVLVEGDLVWLRDPLFANRRGKVTAIRGVPGLDKIRVMLETNGRLVEVKRTDAVLLSESELKDSPYVEPPADESPSMSTTTPAYYGLHPDKAESSRSTSKDNRTSSAVAANTTNGTVAKSDISHNRNTDKQSAVSIATRPVSIAKSDAPKRSWLFTGIRVRLISKKVGSSKSYLQKGWVLDVYGSNTAAVRLDDGNVIEGVKESYLETVLPSTGAMCMVLGGKHRGLTATVLEKRKEKETAIVQLTEELDTIFEISMNDIASFSNTNI